MNRHDTAGKAGLDQDGKARRGRQIIKLLLKGNEMAKKSEHIANELNRISVKNKGLLRPVDVVKFAEDPETALHNCFCWDDNKAAHQYRLQQARQVIEVTVVLIENLEDPVQAFVSLIDDRKQKGGGYRPLAIVMDDAALYAQLLSQARHELGLFTKKYHMVEELGSIFSAIKKTQTKIAMEA